MIYLAPFGFDPSHIISGIAEKGVSEEDKVILIVPEKNTEREEYRQGKKELEKFLDRVGDPALEIVEIDHRKFEEAVVKITKTINAQKEPITLCASQAAREVLLATFIAGMYQRQKIGDVLIFSNVDRRNLEARLPCIVELSDSDKEILQKIEEGEAVNELAEILGVDKSTASRKVKKLEKKDLISTEKQGRKKIIHLGFTGKIYKATF